MVTCASLGWHGQPLGERLAARCGCAVLVQGGASAMTAAAEALFGAGRNAQSLVYYHAGRGISLRFVERGRPLVGYTQRAGELGHVVVAPGGTKCACGNCGCLEAMASGPAIAAAIAALPRRELPENVRALLRKKDGDTTAAVVHAAFAGKRGRGSGPLSRLLADISGYLATGAAMAIAAYDPEMLILGGYLFEDNAALRREIERALPKRVLDWADRGIRVVQGDVLTQDRAAGGGAEVCQRFWANPRGVAVSEQDSI